MAIGEGSGELKQWVIRSVGVFVLALVVGICSASVVAALPPGRHYEMVSEPFKGGYGVTHIEAVAPDGESVAYDSFGAFAGAPANHIGFGFGSTYLARRSGSGWSTATLMVPESIAPYSYPATDFSSTLDQSLFYGQPGSSTGTADFENTESEFLLHRTDALDPTAGFEVAGEVLKTPSVGYKGASADLSHILLNPPEGVSLTPEAAGATAHLYDLMSHGGGEHPLWFVDLNNEAQPKAIESSCEANSGAEGNGQNGKASAFNVLAAKGQEIFFWTGGASEPECHKHEQLFVRLNHSRTLEVSRPLEAGPFGGCVGEAGPPHVAGEVPCEGASTRRNAEFAGASEDGSKVFFMTTEHLVGEDKDSSNDLYMAKIECPSGGIEGCAVDAREVSSLVQVSHDPTVSEAAEVQGIVAVAPDGSRVYFVARGVLSTQNKEGRAPVQGADNLYVYDSTSGSASMTFIADLCSEAARSGEHEDIRCPPNLNSPRGKDSKIVNDATLWKDHESEVQTAGNGRFLLFSSYGQLTGVDTDNARDVYRYDAQSGRLERVSGGEAGYSANGNGNDETGGENADAGIALVHVSEDTHASVQAALGTRAISEDGSRIVFSTAEPLSPTATNGLLNAYEWHDGTVSLVSNGSDEQPVGGPGSIVITPSGDDIFFATVQKLLSQDTDEALDVYDSRFGSGFPIAAGSSEPCSGDACQGPLSTPAPALVPGGTATQAANEDLPPLPNVTPKKLTRARQLARAFGVCRKKPKSKRAACRRSARKKYAKAVKSSGKGRR